MRYTVLDTETYYDKDYSIKDLGNWGYTHDPRFDCYLVSIASSDGFRWCGHPKDCPWDKVSGEDVTLLSVNTGFDMAVTERMAELGLIPKLAYAHWYDVGDLASYIGAPRSLAGSASFLLGKELSKDVRARMSGKRFEDLPEDKQKEVVDYAMSDADIPLEIWMKHSHRWPEHERWLSVHTREMGRRGMPVNMERVLAGIATLQVQLDEALAKIPWGVETGTPLSKRHMALQCEADGIPMPESMAKDSEECAAWENKYADTYEWIRAVRVYRRVNMLLEKVKTLRDRTVDGWFKFSLKYFGAPVTGRWSGDSGFNIQNLNSKVMFGVDIRSMFEAPPGYTFVVVDLSNVEPRVLAWLAKDHSMLEQLKSGMDIYEAHARNTMGYKEVEPLKERAKEEPFLTMRKLSKARVIGLGYRCGKEKFVDVARIIGGLELSPAESEKTVNDYRRTNPKVLNYWAALGKHLANHRGTGQPCVFELPSGRTMTYNDVRDVGGLSCVTCRHGKMTRSKVYDGLVTENSCQGTSRDVLAWHLRTLEDEGRQVVMHAHDELVLLAKIEEAEEVLRHAERVMSTAPPWMPGLPVACEGFISTVYTK